VYPKAIASSERQGKKAFLHSANTARDSSDVSQHLQPAGLNSLVQTWAHQATRKAAASPVGTQDSSRQHHPSIAELLLEGDGPFPQDSGPRGLRWQQRRQPESPDAQPEHSTTAPSPLWNFTSWAHFSTGTPHSVGSQL